MKPDEITFNSLINGMAKNGDLAGSLQLFNQMKNNGLKLTAPTYISLIDSMVKMGMPSILSCSLFQKIN